MDKNSFEVQINGNTYVLKTERSREETDKIVNYVDREIEKAKKSVKYRNPSMYSTLACLNIADKLYDIEIRHKRLIDETKEPLENYNPLKEEYESYKQTHKNIDDNVKILESKVNDLEEKLDNMSKDRERYRNELDRQTKLSEKEKSDNEHLRNMLLEQEKETLQAYKQIQELKKQIRK